MNLLMFIIMSVYVRGYTFSAPSMGKLVIEGRGGEGAERAEYLTVILYSRYIINFVIVGINVVQS